MFAALTLAAGVLAAPVPKDAKPAGPPPHVLDLAVESDGKVRMNVVRTEKRKVTQAVAVRQPNGQVVIENREREVPVTQVTRVELKEVRDLTVYTADGKEADKARALKALADGGAVVVAADGQKVDPRYLRLFKNDVLVLVSPELTSITQTAPVPPRAVAAQAGQIVVQALPAVPPAPLPAPIPKK